MHMIVLPTISVPCLTTGRLWNQILIVFRHHAILQVFAIRLVQILSRICDGVFQIAGT